MDNRTLAALMPEGALDGASPLWAVESPKRTTQRKSSSAKRGVARRRTVGGATGSGGGKVRQLSMLRKTPAQRVGRVLHRSRSTPLSLPDALPATYPRDPLTGGKSRPTSRGASTSTSRPGSRSTSRPGSRSGAGRLSATRAGGSRPVTRRGLGAPPIMRPAAAGSGGSRPTTRRGVPAPTALPPTPLVPGRRSPLERSPGAVPGGSDGANDAVAQIMTLDGGGYDAIAEVGQEDSNDTPAGSRATSPVAGSPSLSHRGSVGSRPRSASGAGSWAGSPADGGGGTRRRYPFNMENHKRIEGLPSPLHPGAGRMAATMPGAGSPMAVPTAPGAPGRSGTAFGGATPKHVQARLNEPAHKPTIHFLPDCAEAEDPATRAAVMHEWIASYQDEENAYSSVVVKNMAKLKRASVFGARLESPNTLETAVAFEVLEEIGSVFGRYNDLLAEITTILRRAVYVDAEDIEGPVFFDNGHMTDGDGTPNVDEVVGLDRSAAAGALREDGEYSSARAAARIKQYIQQQPYFVTAQEMETERADLIDATGRLRAEVSRLEQQQQSLIKQEHSLKMAGKVVNLWKGSIDKSKASSKAFSTDVRTRLNNVKSHIMRSASFRRKEATWGNVGERVMGVINARKVVSNLTEDQRKHIAVQYVRDRTTQQRRTFMRTLLEMCPDVNTAMARHLMMVLLSPTQACMVAQECMATRAEISVADVYNVLAYTLRGPTVVDKVGARAKIMQEMLMAVADDHDRAVCFEALMEDNRNASETAAILRLIAGFDKNLTVEGADLSELRAGYFEGVGSGSLPVPLAGKYDPRITKMILNVASPETQHKLLQDCFATMGKSALAEFWNSVKEGGVLHNYFQVMSDSDKLQFLRVVTSMCDPSMLCKLIVCDFHDHDRPLDADEESDSDEELFEARTVHYRKSKTKKPADAGDVAPPMDIPLPWARYLRKPPRRLDIKEVGHFGALRIVYDCYEKKVAADAVDDRNGNPRESMPEFVTSYLLQKFGVPSMCHGCLFSLVSVLRVNEDLRAAKKKYSKRMHLFAVGCGVVDSEELYTSIYMDILLNLHKQMFRKFSAQHLLNKKERRCYASASRVMQVIDSVFPDNRLPFNVVDRMTIPRDVRDALQSKINSMKRTLIAVEQECQRESESKAPDTGAGSGAGAGSPTARGASMASVMSGPRQIELVDYGKGGMKGLDGDIPIVDIDEVFVVCMRMCRRQMAANKRELVALYDRFDLDKSGVLEYQEFQLLVQACTEEVLPQKTIVKLFQEVNLLDGPASGDSVSSRAFAHLCAQHGITPPPEME